MEPPKNLKPPVPTLKDFQTFDDAGLCYMLACASQFIANAHDPFWPPYWLTFAGTSGIGKTLLLDIIYNDLKKNQRIVQHKTLVSGIRRVHWPTLFTKLYNREFHLMEEMNELNLLCLDEVTAGADDRAAEKDWISRILLPRVGKWTVITTNQTLDSIGKKIDARLASRMIRDGCIAVEVETIDYAKRKGNHQ